MCGTKLKQDENEEEPTCLIDFWMQENLREINEAKINGLQKPFQYSNKELGGYLFDFLFAAQDASTSALLWAIVLLDSHPQVLEKVRSDVARFWSPESEEPLTAEMLREMKYLEAVAREIIRIRAPATMVPHIAGEEFRLTEDYVIPKGTIVFPSVLIHHFRVFLNRRNLNRTGSWRRDKRSGFTKELSSIWCWAPCVCRPEVCY